MNKGLAVIGLLMAGVSNTWAGCPDYLNVEVRALRSDAKLNICEHFGNKPLLIVNTASHCGFAGQFKGLEALHRQYKDQGLVVLGFPSNTFRQEAKDRAKTAEVCYVNYGVTFQMFDRVPVKGAAAHPIFKELARQTKAPSWNFNKYLLDKNGVVVEHFGSMTRPGSDKLHNSIRKLL